MSAYKNILRKVGLVLIGVGVFDIGLMVFAIVNNLSYMSSLNIFAIIAGVYLLKGNLKATQIILWFVAFFLGGIIGVSIAAFWSIPISLIWTYAKFYKFQFLMICVEFILIFILLFWTYRCLTFKVVLDAINANLDCRKIWNKPIVGLGIGLLLVALLIFLLLPLSKGEIVDEAKKRASFQSGSEYQYYVSSIEVQSSHENSSHVSAEVIAYNEREIKNVNVEWDE